MAGTNGGIIGKVNKSSFGKGLTTSKTSGSSTITTQPGTRVVQALIVAGGGGGGCLLYTSPSPRDRTRSRMPSSA